MAKSLVASLLCLSFLIASSQIAFAQQKPVKEWTFLVFLNGKNNLDRFGTLNMNQMEKVGSTDQVNIVVQWGSESAGTTRRVYVQKDNDFQNVTSPVVQDMGKVDMGDWHSVVDFIKWAHENYPAKHYFLDMWDHGAGWHSAPALFNANGGSIFKPSDISWDDETGNFITTEQMGQAMAEAAQIVGHKIDIQGSDACLMGMAEVAHEMSDSVNVFVGAEEVEPVEGWPYDQLLERWTANPTASAAEVGKILTEEFVKAYQGGQYGYSEVTLSAFDLEKMPRMLGAVAGFGSNLMNLSAAERQLVLNAADRTQTYTYSDYADLGDFIDQIEAQQVAGMDRGVMGEVKTALSEFVISNHVTNDYARSQGMAIWLPTSSWTYDRLKDRYNGLKFHKDTNWGAALYALIGTAK